jgi:hypothetical protein
MLITNPLLPLHIFPFPTLQVNGANINLERDAPTKVTFSSAKVIQTTRTVGGYVNSHWGDQLDTMSVSGSVILMPGEEGIGILSLQILRQLYRLDKKKVANILNSISKVTKYASAAAMANTAYGELKTQQWQASANQDISNTIQVGLSAASLAQYTAKLLGGNVSDLATSYIYHDGFIYSGFFNSFDYTRDASNPRFVSYNFRFTIDWSTENTLADVFLSKSGNIVESITGIV